MEQFAKRSDLRRLYKDLSTELEAVELPSDDELHRLIGGHQASEKSGAPYVPLSRPKPIMRYAAAAMLVLGLGAVGWLVQRHQGEAPMVASKGEEPKVIVADSIVEPLRDSVAQTVVTAPPVVSERLAAVQKAEVEPRVQVAADSVVTPEARQQEEMPATMVAETDTAAAPLPLAEQQKEEDTATSRDVHTIDNYPTKPTTTEVDNIIKEENSRRALKSNRKRRMFKRREDFMEKQKEQREKLYIEVEKQLPNQMRMHYVPLGNGRYSTLFY